MRLGLLLVCLLVLSATPSPLLAQQVPGDQPAPRATPAALPAPAAPGAATPTRSSGPAPAGATLLPTPTVATAASPTALPTPSATATSAATPAATPTPAAASASHGNGQWVSNPQALELWSSPEANAASLGRARPGSYFELTGAASETRLYVYNPRMAEYAWIDADAVGPASPPPTGYGASPPRLYTVNLPGRALGFNVRSWPRVSNDTRVRELAHNTPVFVTEAVRGDDGETWYRIGDDEYVHASGIRVPKGPPQMYSGRWIDVDLSEPTMLTAYEDDRIVYTALALHGTIADQTPVGVYRIQRRVENETMDSSTLGVPRDAPGGYYLKDVLYTQYFTGDGAAIHYNYWSSNFGYSGTHGCLGVNLDDAKWFWEWASLGTILSIH